MKSPKQLLKSIGHAINGFLLALKEEASAKIQSFIAIIAIIMGIYFQLPKIEWIMLVISIMAVLSAEVMNSAIENLADKITLEQDPFIKKAKDMGAGAVFVVAVGSLIVGCIIFIPKFIS